MGDVLPSQTGLSVNGLIYQYTTEKDPNADMKVHIQNENALGEGYILKYTDDWSGVPGNTINKVITFPDIQAESIGQGSIEVEGEGTVLDPTVVYAYKFDECSIPLADPSCPGYFDARYQWLKDNGLLEGLSPDDPYYDEWVQMTLDREANLEEDEEDVKEEEEEEEEEINKLNGSASISALADTAQQASIMEALSTIPNFENYYAVDIQGGVYQDTLTLQDAKLPDNARAMKSLAEDNTHRSMIRSQYENKQLK
jgi:hypothetical protein